MKVKKNLLSLNIGIDGCQQNMALDNILLPRLIPNAKYLHGLLHNKKMFTMSRKLEEEKLTKILKDAEKLSVIYAYTSLLLGVWSFFALATVIDQLFRQLGVLNIIVIGATILVFILLKEQNNKVTKIKIHIETLGNTEKD